MQAGAKSDPVPLGFLHTGTPLADLVDFSLINSDGPPTPAPTPAPSLQEDQVEATPSNSEIGDVHSGKNSDDTGGDDQNSLTQSSEDGRQDTSSGDASDHMKSANAPSPAPGPAPRPDRATSEVPDAEAVARWLTCSSLLLLLGDHTS